MNGSYRLALIAGVAALSMTLASSSVRAQTIDLFTTAQLANSTFTAGTVNGGVTIIGTYRDAIYSAGTGTSAQMSISAGSAAFTRGADNSFISLDWDGNNDAITFDATGLGGVDLTAGGANGFQFSATVNSGTLDFTLLVHTDDPNSSIVPVSTVTSGAKTVCYSDFAVLGGSGADFANVGAIQLVTGGSTATDWSIGALTYGVVGGCSLPVEMTSFDALSDGNSVALAWTTASETNTVGFAVEHRRAVAAESDWQEIGFVDAAGTSTETRNYGFASDAFTAGRHAFRLKVVDVDGRFDYSETIEVSIEAPGSFILGSAYPNPFNPSTSFALSVKRDQVVDIAVFDLLGRNVQQIFNGPLTAGDARTFRVDGASLTTGIYVIRASGEYESRSTPVMLVK